MDISVKKKKNHSSGAEELPLPKAFYKDLKLIINFARHFHLLQNSKLDSLHLPLDPGLAGNEKV